MAAVAIEFGRNAMTEQAEELTRGDALARVDVLEAEVAELRKRVCVPDVSTMARALSDRAASAYCVDPDDNWKIYGQEFIEDVQAMLAAPAPVERLATDGGRNQRFEGLFEGETPDQRDARLASAAPVERVEQEAVAMLLIDDATTAESGDWDIEPIPAAIEKLARSGGAALPLYTTPQPAPTAAPDVEGLLALADAVTPQIIDWVRCGLSTNGHLTDGSHPALNKLREAYCALAHQSGGAK